MSDVTWQVQALVGGIVKTYTQANLAAFLAEVLNAREILAEMGIVVAP